MSTEGRPTATGWRQCVRECRHEDRPPAMHQTCRLVPTRTPARARRQLVVYCQRLSPRHERTAERRSFSCREGLARQGPWARTSVSGHANESLRRDGACTGRSRGAVGTSSRSNPPRPEFGFRVSDDESRARFVWTHASWPALSVRKGHGIEKRDSPLAAAGGNRYTSRLVLADRLGPA